MKKVISLMVGIVVILAIAATPVSAAKKDTKAPVITKTNPVDYGTEVMIDGSILIRFSETVQKGKNIGKITWKETETKSIGFTYEITDKFLKLTPKAALKYNTFYTVTITAAAVKDAAGNNFAKAYSFNFITEEDPAKAVNPSNSGKSLTYILELEATLDEELTEVKLAYFEAMLKQFGINATFRNVYLAEKK